MGQRSANRTVSPGPRPPDLTRDWSKEEEAVTHRSRLCHFVIDVDDLDSGVAFWSAALDAKEEQLGEESLPVYRRLRLPDSDIRILLQRTHDPKTTKERMHFDLETDDTEAEVRRLEALGATRWDHQQERGYDFWVLRDPWGNEFCVLEPNFPELLLRRAPQ
jgi:predicted enzyme related to lactoylglutathione lyase